jgi:ribosome-associated protein
MPERSEKKAILIKLREHDEYIKLGQAMKAAALVYSGVEAKEVIQAGLVKVNDKVEKRRGRKLYNGDFFTFEIEKVKIEI